MLGKDMVAAQHLALQVQCWFAYDAFVEDRGTNPTSIHDLVPEYLREVPSDRAFGRAVEWVGWDGK
jgi:hypothetical protein